jgi:hypothetical protein
MKFSIYFYQGVQETLVCEKFDSPNTKEVQIYVWKSLDGSLGFNCDDLSLRFVKEFIKNAITISFPDLQLIDNEKQIEKNIQNLIGITFFNNFNLIKEEFEKYKVYEEKKKRNSLLARYGKVTEELKVPILINWYDNKEKKYTKAFLDYCINNRIEFITWAFSDFGIYFFSFSEINRNVEFIAEKLGVGFCKVDNMLKMPYH